MPKATIDAAEQLKNGIHIPTKEVMVFMNKEIIRHRKTNGRHDPFGVRNDADLDLLIYRLNKHQYKKNPISNSLYVSTEILFTIACRHPFLEANKTTAFSVALLLLEINLEFYVSPITGKTYGLWKPADDKESIHVGRMIEKIAKWGEGSDLKALGALLLKEKLIKKARELSNEDVKRFIKHFLSKYIIESV